MLTSKQFENVEFDESEKDFEFIVGNSHFCCNHIIAAFLSPKIARLREVDAATLSYCISNIEEGEIFEQFLSLCSGDEIVVNSSITLQICELLRTYLLIEKCK
jgi:hypothetical protein